MTDNSNPVDNDLDTFEKAFFEQPEEIAVEEVEAKVEVEDIEADALATDEDTDAEAATSDDDETPDEDSEEPDEDSDDPDKDDEKSDEEEDEKEPEPERKGNKRKSAQERINEITRRAREAERREAALLQRLEALESRDKEVAKEEPIQAKLPQGAPTPDAVNEKGEPLYPLGEFDPLFIRDLTKFTIAEETKAAKAAEAEQTQAKELAKAKEELRTSWNQKLDSVEEELPEIRENIVDLVETFQELEPAYGEYLAMTIMQSENGPQIMDYLSKNIGEAQVIVASGPAAATLAIGRLDARLARARPNEEEKRNQKKMSAAPAPPAQATRGRKGQATVRPDTDDLNAFERVFYEK